MGGFNHVKNCHHLKPLGLPILPNLPRYETFAVAGYGCMSHAPDRRISGFRHAQLAYLRQTQQSLNLGELYMKLCKNRAKTNNYL